MTLRYTTISFLTDYGHDDEFVGIVKSVIRGLAPDTEDGTLAVWLPRGLLAPGKYRLELYRDGEPAPRERVGEYDLAVRP